MEENSPTDILKQRWLNNGQVVGLMFAVVTGFTAYTTIQTSIAKNESVGVVNTEDIKKVNSRIDRKVDPVEKAVIELQNYHKETVKTK